MKTSSNLPIPYQHQKFVKTSLYVPEVRSKKGVASPTLGLDLLKHHFQDAFFWIRFRIRSILKTIKSKNFNTQREKMGGFGWMVILALY